MDGIKLKIIACLILFTASVYADSPVSPRLDSLKYECIIRFKAGGGTTDQLTSARLRFAVNEGIAVVARDFPAIPKDTVVTMDADSHWVALPVDFDRLEAVFRPVKYQTDSAWYPLKTLAIDSFKMLEFTKAQFTQDKQDGMSPRYASAFGQKLYTSPIFLGSSIGSDLRVFYYASGVRLNADSDTTIILPKYRSYIIDYAVAKLYEMTGQLNMASYFMSLYKSDAETRKRAVSYQEITE